MFKVNWEKTSITYQLPEGMVEKMLSLAYPYKKLTSFELIAGGCANLNFKIQLKNEKHPLILRVYLRDKDAADREQKLAELIKETVPLPLTHYIGELTGRSGCKATQKPLESPLLLGFLYCFTMFAMTVRKVIAQKSGGDQFAIT